MDDTDRRLIDRLQDSFPLDDRPFRTVAEGLALDEDDVIARVRRLRETGVLTRFGPLHHAERMGGALLLAALKVPPEEFERVAALVNELPEVAHNYARGHAFNMWFVLATETPEGIDAAIEEIERRTGLTVHPMPKLAEYFVCLRFAV